MENQYRILAEEIRQKSSRGLIAWAPGNYQTTYTASLGRGAIMIAFNDQEDCYTETPPLYSLFFLNERGETFHAINVYSRDESNADYQRLKDIYDQAHNSYMKIDETLKSMFDDIQSK